MVVVVVVVVVARSPVLITPPVTDDVDVKDTVTQFHDEDITR